MTEQCWYSVRSCCTSPTMGRRCTEPLVMPEGEKSTLTGPVKEVVAAEPPPRDPMIAAHEASHGVVSHAFGLAIERIWIDGLHRVTYAAGRGRKLRPRELAIVYLAGDFGSNWTQRRWIARPHDSETLERVSSWMLCEHGYCDQCQAVIQIAAIVGVRAPAAEYLRQYRELEEATLALVQRPDVVRATRAVAGRLMEVGVLDGAAAHDLIAASGLPFNSIAIGDPAKIGEHQ